jgi:hypothetical protein
MKFFTISGNQSEANDDYLAYKLNSGLITTMFSLFSVDKKGNLSLSVGANISIFVIGIKTDYSFDV